MAPAFDSGGGSKRRRIDEEGDQGLGDTEAAAAEEEDCISALPEALRLHILGLLPFKSAIRTGALSTRWRDLWTHRWPAPSSLDLRLDTHAPAASILESLEQRRRRRIDRFSFSFQIDEEELQPDSFHRITDYAAACSVADLHVDCVYYNFALVFKLRLPRGDPHLTRLALGGIRVGLSKPWSRCHTFSVLEVISLHGVTLSDTTLENLVAASPLLRTLGLCYCDGLHFVSLEAAGAQLRSLTIAECRWVEDVSTMEASSSLRSFRYSGSYIRALRIPATCPLADLYICFGGPAGRGRYGPSTPVSLRFAWPAEVPRNWLQALTNFSNLTVLTLCSSALRRVSAKARERSRVKSAVPCKLQNLRELQLLMFAMYDSSLDDIYIFIVACCPPLLRLFVELPTNSHYYRPELEPPESEDELLEPGEELPEKEPPEEVLSEEEEVLQEELPEGEASEANLSEDDWSDEELSDGGQASEEPVEDRLENLKLLKMTNFKGDDNEMNLIRFVLRNSTSLNQLLLFTSKSDQPEWLKKNHVDTTDILEKILHLEKAWPNAQIILGESDGDAVQPLHRKAFADV
uniref:Uncharacterized protein n=1 Tax=Avena sativa TaxID=4498 RepID=A0ACD5XLA4_AVESA